MFARQILNSMPVQWHDSTYDNEIVDCIESSVYPDQQAETSLSGSTVRSKEKIVAARQDWY